MKTELGENIILVETFPYREIQINLLIKSEILIFFWPFGNLGIGISTSALARNRHSNINIAFYTI